MRTIEKRQEMKPNEMKLARRLGGVGEYYFSKKLREIDRMRASGRQIINLGIGSPDRPPHPDVIGTLAAEAAKPGNHGYQPYKGAAVLREAFALWYKERYGVALDPEGEILPLIGSKEGVMHVCMTYLDEGDRVLVPNPGYPTYRSAVTIAGGVCVDYVLREDGGWMPDFDEIERGGLQGVKMMIVNYPHMPTGAAPKEGLFRRLVDFARRHGVPKSYTDAAALIADPEVDIVYVATPPGTHRELAVQALEAGKPVYVEKPMAMNHAECLEMIAAAEKAGQKLFVAYYRRALPYFLKVKELLDGGSVGQPLTAEVRLLRPERPEDRDPARLPWRLRREVGGEGYFHDLAPHTLDILDFLLGEITDARGCKSNRGGFYDVADTVAASFRFRSGVPGTGMWCFVAPPSAAEDSVVVTGRKGSVRFSTFDFTPVELVTARGVERFEIAPPEHIQGPLIETIVRELRGEGVCPSTGVSAARTSRVMDEIMKE